MNKETRIRYFAFWIAACKVKGWDARDQELRRGQVMFCMDQVGGPMVTTSDPAFARDETTALLVYLDHLAHPDDLVKAAAWVDCMKDYRAYNRAKQADWHEEEAYGAKGSGKLRRNRFGGQQKAAGDTFDPLDPKAIEQRFLTMRRANERRTGYVNPRDLAPAPAAVRATVQSNRPVERIQLAPVVPLDDADSPF